MRGALRLLVGVTKSVASTPALLPGSEVWLRTMAIELALASAIQSSRLLLMQPNAYATAATRGLIAAPKALTWRPSTPVRQ